MTTSWGCDTEAVQALAATADARAALLLALIDRLRAAADAVDWHGPDAQAHRGRTAAVTAAASALCRTLRDRAAMLRDEAAQQEHASQAEPSADPLRLMAAELPGLEEVGRWIGGPLRARPGGQGFPIPPALPGGAGPWIGGPLQRPSGAGARQPLPAGEDFALTADRLEGAERLRRRAFASTSYTALAQSAMDIHAAVGAGLDLAETALTDHGLGAFVPLVSLARIPHATSSLLVGEESTAGQVTGQLEHLAANVHQTGAEVADAIGRGDVAAAIRAGERGAFRHHEGVLGVVTASPLWEVPAVGAEALGHAADAVEGVSPAAAQGLREAEHRSAELGEHVEGVRETWLGGESWYDARRRAVTLPWDPGA
ncbi:hypothetical protein [Brachybacterium sp. UNK5269]|uniref:hypothetical protein n=1 Tax=Brachybacterium sp. UNK5269 TaxID=3408576 RepID=UPI003BB0AEBF